MDKIITSFVGLDVHKDAIAMGVAPTGRKPPRFAGTVVPQWAPLSKAHRLLQVRARALNQQLRGDFARWHPQLRSESDPVHIAV